MGLREVFYAVRVIDAAVQLQGFRQAILQTAHTPN